MHHENFGGKGRSHRAEENDENKRRTGGGGAQKVQAEAEFFAQRSWWRGFASVKLNAMKLLHNNSLSFMLRAPTRSETKDRVVCSCHPRSMEALPKSHANYLKR